MKFTPLLLIFGIVAAAAIPSFAQVEEQPIPDWLRQNARWWAERQITDEEFVNGIEYLLSIGVINVETPRELEYKNQIAQLQQEKAQLEADNREVNDILTNVDRYLSSKGMSVPQEIWLGNSTGQTPEPVQCGEGTVLKNGVCVLVDTKDTLRELAYLWGSNQITQTDYVGELQILVSSNKIEGLNCTNTSTQTNSTMPEWIKDTARFYSSSSIRYDEFLVHLDYLCKAGFLHR